MNRLSVAERAKILGCLVEGNSIRATCRLTGAAKGTVLKLLIDVGVACAEYQDKALRNLPCKKIQCDEIWAFCGMKEKNVPRERRGMTGVGDVYTWTAICADSKLMVSWLVGKRDVDHANPFIRDLSERLANRVQLSTDGHHAYLTAVEKAFGGDIDYGMLIKIYGRNKESDGRYSPPECIGAEKQIRVGRPADQYISTSYVERQNLTMRMGMRRFTRLTNAFSKKIENLEAAVALHFMHYNFGRVHQKLRVTPAMEAGISDHVWELEEIASLIDKNSN
jgi:IS1 family transposase